MKNMLKLLGIAALVAVIGLTIAACSNGTTSKGGSKKTTTTTGNSVTYAGYANGSTYFLIITENTARYAAQTGDTYEMFNGDRVSRGTVEVSGNDFTLTPSTGDPITVTVSGTNITAMDGSVKWDNGSTESLPASLTSIGNAKSIRITGINSENLTKVQMVGVYLMGDDWKNVALQYKDVSGGTLIVDLVVPRDGSWNSQPDGTPNAKWTGSGSYWLALRPINGGETWYFYTNGGAKAVKININSALTSLEFNKFDEDDQSLW